ncbi:MAG: type II toxin-antitoxin system HicB family antitoxin [Chloroflexi bacterium]|nr:type II toxin-antitoxin system HicB family antitoxin [Chloroflexota bacterium]
MGKIRYSVVIEWDEETNFFVATVPALTVSTYGDTREEAIEMVKEAIAVTVEGLRAIGWPVPEGDAGVVQMVEVTV